MSNPPTMLTGTSSRSEGTLAGARYATMVLTPNVTRRVCAGEVPTTSHSTATPADTCHLCLVGRALPRELPLEDPVWGLWEQPTRQSATGAAKARDPRGKGPGPYHLVANRTWTAKVWARRRAATTGRRTRQARSWRTAATRTSGTRNWKIRSTSPLEKPQDAAASTAAAAAASTEVQARSRTTATIRAAKAASSG